MTTNTRITLFIHLFRERHGYAPTVREVADGAGLSVAATWTRLAVLKRAGWLDWTPGRTRTLRLIRPIVEVYA